MSLVHSREAAGTIHSVLKSVSGVALSVAVSAGVCCLLRHTRLLFRQAMHVCLVGTSSGQETCSGPVLCPGSQHGT